MALLFGLGIVAPVPVVRAVRAADFLASLGANSGINGRGEKIERTIECAKYLGLRWFRSGTEGDPTMADLLRLRREAGVRFSWSPGSGGSDLPKLLATARELARADALLAFEGPNEPNNWGIVYRGEKGGGRDGASWKAVAAFQRDLYAAVKADPRLRRYPVWGISETGAENDNVGLQFLTVPRGAGTLLPDGTRYADAANCHNYVYHPNSPGVEPNKTWNAADPSAACKVDGLFGNHGPTWLRKFPGYSEKELRTLPRVTTETGCTIGGPVTEEIHARNLLTLYLDQFKRGWSHTAVYLLRDRIDEGGNQAFGFFRADDTPRRAALYLHNLTTVLDDRENDRRPGGLAYRIEGASPTVHDLLLQKRDGSFALVVWAERTEGADRVTLRFGKPSGAVRLYDPTAGTGATEVLGRTDVLRLSLTDHPIIVELKG